MFLNDSQDDELKEATQMYAFFQDYIRGTFDDYLRKKYKIEDKSQDISEYQNLSEYLHYVNSRSTVLGCSLQAAFRYLTKACSEIDHTDPTRELILKALECLEVGMRGQR